MNNTANNNNNKELTFLYRIPKEVNTQVLCDNCANPDEFTIYCRDCMDALNKQAENLPDDQCSRIERTERGHKVSMRTI